jgi:hypothetical protein
MLAHRDPEWWVRCWVTAAHGLVSADPVIAGLLAPPNRAMETLDARDADAGVSRPSRKRRK